MEIDGELCEKIRIGATAQGENTTHTWNRARPKDVASQKFHYETFYNEIIRMSNMIQKKTNRVSATFIIGGIECANIIETLDAYQPMNLRGQSGPHVAGTLKGLTFIKNPYFPDDEFVVGYKGMGIDEGGMAYMPYLPLMSSQMIMSSDFIAKQGYTTAYGSKLVNSDVFARGMIVNEPEV